MAENNVDKALNEIRSSIHKSKV